MVLAIDVHGLGGACQWDGRGPPLHAIFVAWGGVLAQLVLYAVAATVSWLEGPPPPGFWADLGRTLLGANLFVAALNLLPVRDLDGRKAWGILPYLVRVTGLPEPPTRESIREPSRRPPPPRPDPRADEALPPLPPEVEQSIARIMSRKEKPPR